MKDFWEKIKQWLPWLLLVPLLVKIFQNKKHPNFTDTSAEERIDAVNKAESKKRKKIKKQFEKQSKRIKEALQRDLERNEKKWGK